MKLKSFFFHYNKPASMKAGKVQISLHYDKVCHILDNLICYVTTTGRVRKGQPRFVMTGKCGRVDIVDGVGYIF